MSLSGQCVTVFIRRVACAALSLAIMGCGSDSETPDPAPTTSVTAPEPLDANRLLLDKGEIAEVLGVSEGDLGLGFGGLGDRSPSMQTWCSDVETPVDSGAISSNLAGVGQSAYVFATEEKAIEVMQRAAATPAPCEWDLGPFVVPFPTPPSSVEGLGDEAVVIAIGATEPTVELQVRSGRAVVLMQVDARVVAEVGRLPEVAEQLARRALARMDGTQT